MLKKVVNSTPILVHWMQGGTCVCQQCGGRRTSRAHLQVRCQGAQLPVLDQENHEGSL